MLTNSANIVRDPPHKMTELDFSLPRSLIIDCRLLTVLFPGHKQLSCSTGKRPPICRVFLFRFYIQPVSSTRMMNNPTNA